jgi:hypothetical protein
LLTNPSVVAVSGRTEEAVQEFLKEVEQNQNDPEFIALVNEIHANNIPGHEFRGYTVLGTDQKVSEVMVRYLIFKIYFSYIKRAILTGMEPSKEASLVRLLRNGLPVGWNGA